MNPRERLLSVIERLSDEKLEQLYDYASQLKDASRPSSADGLGFLEQLSRIQIDGPEDFAENLDLYLTGERQFDPNLH